MVTKTKKATVVAKKAKTGKPEPKKAVSAKKTAPAKKAAAAKKPAAKKPAVNKKLKKVPAVRKAAAPPVKNQKKSNLIKKHSPVKKPAKAGVKKAVPKKLATPKKTAVKKPVATAKKTAPKKPAAPAKKAVPVKNTKVSKPVQHKPAVKSAPKPAHVPATPHKAELKKALEKVKTRTREEIKKPLRAFVMPKTNTEKARKYEPEFTKSVLDHSPIENNGPSLRYSDNELTEFRELITRKLETAKKELGYLQGLITRKDQMGGDESDNRYMTMEDGSLSMEREQLSQMASRQITFIDHLEKAMMRIENKTYGICRVTGKLIDKARLRAVPHATLSIEAKMGIAK
jgi:RNA polymerase-binding transcription factor DksA